MNASDFPTVYELRVRYSEIDAQALVYNPIYLAYFDYAITEYIRASGLPILLHESDTPHLDFNTVKALVEYKAPAFFDDLLNVCCRLGRLGNSSLTFELAIFRQTDDVLIATGEVVWVYADQREYKSVPIPDDMRAKLKR